MPTRQAKALLFLRETSQTLTNSNWAAYGVVQAAHVVHLAAVGGVVEHRRCKEAKVVRRPGYVHSPSKCHSFTCRVEVKLATSIRFIGVEHKLNPDNPNCVRSITISISKELNDACSILYAIIQH